MSSVINLAGTPAFRSCSLSAGPQAVSSWLHVTIPDPNPNPFVVSAWRRGHLGHTGCMGSIKIKRGHLGRLGHSGWPLSLSGGHPAPRTLHPKIQDATGQPTLFRGVPRVQRPVFHGSAVQFHDLPLTSKGGLRDSLPLDRYQNEGSLARKKKGRERKC